ncbi:hypothetical protein GF357_01600 [Candidatus Dojkabacteria bacterium]|nr:hypothetical protein [Candidatus Dojkabacteria bacterium]
MKKITLVITLACMLTLALGFIFFEWHDLPFIDYGWGYLNNQSVAVFITFLIALVGYYLGFEYWKQQHKKELYNEYIRKFLEYIMRWYTIKKDQTNYRVRQTKANKNKQGTEDSDLKKDYFAEERFCHEQKMNLDGERNKVSGQIDFYKLMINKMAPEKDPNNSVIAHIYKEYHEFGKFEKKKVGSAKYEDINKEWDNSYKRIKELIEKINL